MKKFTFENLNVYQNSIGFANQIFEISGSFQIKHQSSIGDQLRRSALSISNNIAEGMGRRYKKEKKQFLQMSASSAFECVPTLKIALLQNLITQDQFDQLYGECYATSKMLSSLIKSVDKFK